MAKQYEQMKLSDRPKRWKQKAFEVMNEAVHTRQERLLSFILDDFLTIGIGESGYEWKNLKNIAVKSVFNCLL